MPRGKKGSGPAPKWCGIAVAPQTLARVDDAITLMGEMSRDALINLLLDDSAPRFRDIGLARLDREQEKINEARSRLLGHSA